MNVNDDKDTLPGQERETLTAREPVDMTANDTECAPSEQEASLADRLMGIAKASAPHFKEPFKSTDHGDLLYDERGLPR